jgi:hypothetical protein
MIHVDPFSTIIFSILALISRLGTLEKSLPRGWQKCLDHPNYILPGADILHLVIVFKDITLR